ncbi:SART-1-domain-containing protein, partial [Rozella allomycis CSF55]
KFKIADLKNGKPEEKPNLPENYTIDTLDISYLKESNDYMAVDSTIKKSKKKRKIRTKPIDKEDLLDFTETGNLIDDFDLQKELSKTRTKKLNKMKILTAEEIAQNILEEKTYGSINDDNDNKKGLVISSTSEFVKNLCSKKDSQPPIDSKPKVNLESLKVTPAPVKREEIKADDNVEMEIETTMEIPNENETSDADLAPVIEEPLVRSGVAATLSLLGQSGVLTSKDIVTDKDALGIEHSEWLAQQRQLEKERLAQKAKLRDKNDHYKEIQKSRDIERKKIEKFKDYKPEIKLEYFDDFGRKLAPKDAFRQLCYQFHGHKPGKNKTDKILRKIKEEEDLKMAMEKSLSANSALENARKAAGTSHVVLTSGNKVVLSDKVPKKLLKEVRKRRNDVKW